MRILLIFCLTFTSLAAGAQKQQEHLPFVMGVTDKITSTVLSEPRTLNIYLPEGYNDSNAHYPVIYLLDGSANEDFLHIAGLTQFLTMINVLPPSIVVGIANVDRRRDFVFPLTIKQHMKLMPTAGGSAKFMSFIEQELQPYIEHTYRTTSRKTIIGQSLGGLFATEVLLRKPQLFTDYIIVSPSLWVDNESLLSAAPALIKSHPGAVPNVYISVGSEGAQMIGDAKKLVALLQKNAAKQMSIHYEPMPAENHLTILHRSAYKAFEVLNAPAKKH